MSDFAAPFRLAMGAVGSPPVDGRRRLAEVGGTALLVVSRIRLEMSDGAPLASGGELSAELGWDIGAWDRQPLAYRLWRP